LSNNHIVRFLNHQPSFSWSVDCLDWDWGLVGGATGFAHNEIDAEAHERAWVLSPGPLVSLFLKQRSCSWPGSDTLPRRTLPDKGKPVVRRGRPREKHGAGGGNARNYDGPDGPIVREG